MHAAYFGAERGFVRRQISIYRFDRAERFLLGRSYRRRRKNDCTLARNGASHSAEPRFVTIRHVRADGAVNMLVDKTGQNYRPAR